MKFYKCPICGNIIHKINDSGVHVMCCGQKMQEIISGTIEASHEKHIPVPVLNGNVVSVNAWWSGLAIYLHFCNLGCIFVIKWKAVSHCLIEHNSK